MPNEDAGQAPISFQANLVPNGDPVVLDLPAGRNSTVRIECLGGGASPVVQITVTMEEPENFKAVPVKTYGPIV